MSNVLLRMRVYESCIRFCESSMRFYESSMRVVKRGCDMRVVERGYVRVV